jgi:hypothetical protein
LSDGADGSPGTVETVQVRGEDYANAHEKASAIPVPFLCSVLFPHPAAAALLSASGSELVALSAAQRVNRLSEAEGSDLADHCCLFTRLDMSDGNLGARIQVRKFLGQHGRRHVFAGNCHGEFLVTECGFNYQLGDGPVTECFP